MHETDSLATTNRSWRFCETGRPDRDGDRPSKGKRHQIEFIQKFWNAAARRISQSTPFDEACGKIRQADHYVAGHPGAYPGIEAEERGQAEAIARNLFEMSHLPVPIVVVVIGEGASAVHWYRTRRQDFDAGKYVYSVIAPESCSSILWRSWEYKEQAAEALRLTARDLLEQKLSIELFQSRLAVRIEIPADSHNTEDTLIEELRVLKN